MPPARSPDDDPDDQLVDDELESEIELVSELVVAATSSDGPLGQDELDDILGVSPKADGPATET